VFFSRLDTVHCLGEPAKRDLVSEEFRSEGENYNTQVNVESESPNKGYALIYRKDDSTGWYWAGLSVGDSKTLDKLLEGS